MYTQIMVAYDDSVEAKGALAEALDLAATFKATLVIVSILEPTPPFYDFAAIVAPEFPAQLNAWRRNQIETSQSQAIIQAEQRGVDARLVLREGDEVTELVKAASDVGPDLFVLGLHKHGSLARWFGTAHLIAQSMQCSMLASTRTVS